MDQFVGVRSPFDLVADLLLSAESVVSSVQSLDRLGRRGDMKDDSAEILFQSFSAGGPCEQFWHGQGCPHFDIVLPAFQLPITASPALQGALKDGFGEAVVMCDMPEPRKFQFLVPAEFLWTHKEVDLAPHPVVGLALQVEDAESFLRHLVSKAWTLFFPESASRVHVSQP